VSREHICRCPLCSGVPTADPDHGYDTASVPAAPCLYCREAIGDQEYVLIPINARHGQMHVAHAACDGRSAVERRRDEATLARHAARTRAHAARVAAGGGR
jgi:hypothetical protein